MFKPLVSALVLTLACATNVWAADEASFSNYDSIVNELKASSTDEKPQTSADDAEWDDVAIHGGLGLATSYVSPTAPSGVSGAGFLTGVEFNFGINLFTRLLRAEGAFSNFTQSELNSGIKADLKEFELRLIYTPETKDGILLRFGAGLAARYMSIDSYNGGNWTNAQSSTPSSLFLVGFEKKLTKSLAIGPDVSYRSTLVGDTFDRSAWDASLRLNATF
jgi:hypothetical protein